jgi:hypothetical protein
MKVGELKKLIAEIDDDLEVYVYADHGQTMIKCSDASIGHVESLSYYGETPLFSEGVKVLLISD